jgi:hypothetical protein
VSSWEEVDDCKTLSDDASFSSAIMNSSSPPWHDRGDSMTLSISDSYQEELSREDLHGITLTTRPRTPTGAVLPSNLYEAIVQSFRLIDGHLEENKHREAVRESDFVIDQLLIVLSSSTYSRFVNYLRKCLKKAFIIAMDCYVVLNEWFNAERTAVLFNREFKDNEHSYTSLAFIKKRRKCYRDAVEVCDEGLQRFAASRVGNFKNINYFI